MPQDPQHNLYDSNGNRLGSLWIDSSGALAIQHADSSETVTLDGDGLHAPAVDTDALTVGGCLLYEEDDNSPFEFTGESSQTYTLSQNFSHVMVLYDTAENIGLDQLQVNGDTGSNYDYVDNSDTETTGQTEWAIPFTDESAGFELIDGGNKVAMSVSLMSGRTGQTIAGQNENLGGSAINQFTISDSGDTNRDFRARVFGRSL